jgi:hypothetical protein
MLKGARPKNRPSKKSACHIPVSKKSAIALFVQGSAGARKTHLTRLQQIETSNIHNTTSLQLQKEIFLKKAFIYA